MSVSRWRYTTACDDHMGECVGDCDLCSFEPKEMTREEAIEKLEAFAPFVVDDTREAVDMAIEALSTYNKCDFCRNAEVRSSVGSSNYKMCMSRNGYYGCYIDNISDRERGECKAFVYALDRQKAEQI